MKRLRHGLCRVILPLAFLWQIILPCWSFLSQTNGVITGRDWTRPFITIINSRSESNPQEEPALTGRLIPWNLPKLLEIANDDSDDDYRKRLLQDVYSAAMVALETQEKMTSMEYPSETSLPFVEIEPVRRFLRSYSHDRGHHGRFAVPFGDESGKDQISLPANLVFSMDRPLTYLRNVLSYPPGGSSNKGGFQRNKQERDEVVLFLPGPNTPFQQPSPAHRPGSGEQLQHLSQVLLEGMPLTLLQVKSHTTMVDHDDWNATLTVPLQPELLEALESSKIVERESKADHFVEKTDNAYRVKTSDLDIIQSCCSPATSDDALITTLVKLIDSAVQSVLQDTPEEPHLVLFTCSTTARMVATAIEKWKNLVTSRNTFPSSIADDYSRTRSMNIKQEEELLQEALTVVTMSSLCRHFPDGPAYVHISMHDDPLVAKFGVTRKEPRGVGKGALILQTVSPYKSNTADKGSQSTTMLYNTDAHNINACAIQFLSLVLRINGVTSFRQLYNMGSRPTAKLDIEKSLYALNYDDTVGDLELPQDELLISIIKATGAERWLWNHYDNDDSALPNFHTAEALIIEHLGYGVYEEIFEACFGRPLVHQQSDVTKA